MLIYRSDSYVTHAVASPSKKDIEVIAVNEDDTPKLVKFHEVTYQVLNTKEVTPC